MIDTRDSFPLAMAQEGETLRVVGLTGGRNLARRLTELGLPVGAELELVTTAGGGQLVVAVGGLRLGLGRGMAHKIMVAPVTAANGGDHP
jgi:ferrous iron transport protein A